MPRAEPEPAPAGTVAVDVVVASGDWPPRPRLVRLARRAIGAAVALLPADLSPGLEVAVVFSDDSEVRKLNRKFRGKDRPTNVLSFPAAPARHGAGAVLGDIILSCQTVVKEAEAQGLTLADHLTHLIVHGFLHLLGHDHEIDTEAVMMERLETAILARLGIADPYADRAGDDAAAGEAR